MTPDEWRTMVGSRIQARREEMGITVEAAARFAGRSRSWWKQLENGYRNDGGAVSTINPKAESLSGAARAIGWTPDSIARLKRGLEPLEAERGRTDLGSPAPSSWQQAALDAICAEVVGCRNDLQALREELRDHREAVEADAGTRKTIDALAEQVKALTVTLARRRPSRGPSQPKRRVG